MRVIFALLIVIAAVVIAALNVLGTQSVQLTAVVTRINHFFGAMLPILATGALINYLWHSCRRK